MISRRQFLESLGVGAAGALAGCCCPFCGGRKVRFAAQLWSIHSIFWKEPENTLTGLRKAGFDGVEFAGYGDRTAKDLKRMLDDAGMTGMGTHVNGFVDLVGDQLRKTLDFAAELGLESVVTPHAICQSADEYRKFGRDMSAAAEVAKTYGIHVGVHTTYDHFLRKFDGKTGWELLFSEASPLLGQQIDTGNVFHTGTDVVALLKRYPGTHFSVHLKENEPTATATFGEPVEGGKNVPWREVLDALAAENVAWYVLEAEKLPDSLKPLSDSLTFIRRLGV